MLFNYIYVCRYNVTLVHTINYILCDPYMYGLKSSLREQSFTKYIIMNYETTFSQKNSFNDKYFVVGIISRESTGA